METDNEAGWVPDELQTPAGNEAASASEPETDVEATVPQPKKIKHSDHSVSRKYRMFSNHCSANDMPHTNTMF